MRRCSRSACLAPAVATMTYDYAGSTAVLGPLALSHEPGTYDLCGKHAESTSVPRGWEVIRLPQQEAEPVNGHEDTDDDLMALANAVRQIGLRHDEVELPPAPEPPQLNGKPQLRMIRD